VLTSLLKHGAMSRSARHPTNMPAWLAPTGRSLDGGSDD
jgi:hypothetical protein